jgi:hypothetical protein
MFFCSIMGKNPTRDFGPVKKRIFLKEAHEAIPFPFDLLPSPQDGAKRHERLCPLIFLFFGCGLGRAGL